MMTSKKRVSSNNLLSNYIKSKPQANEPKQKYLSDYDTAMD